MRDIPIFTGRYGAASLILREIPFSGCAYVLVQAAAEGQAAAFLDECRAFCRAAGAAQSLASADVPLPLAHAYDLLQLCCRRSDLQPPGRPVELTPVTAENAGTYQAVYRQLFRTVPGAADCTARRLADQLARGERACLALEGGRVAGIGQWADGTEGVLRTIGVLPEFRGLGTRLTGTILGRMAAETVSLEVASVNGPALALYRRIGFRQAEVLSRWYWLDPVRGR